jgi:quinol monooxygenase YgiN
MDAKQLLIFSASMLASAVAPAAHGEEAQGRYVQIAEIEVDPAQIENYRAAVNEQIEAAIRTEPGVLVLYAVAERDDATRVRVFEIYRDAAAYRAHLEAPHFKKYKATTETMVRSLKLVPVVPIALGAKS